MWMRAGSYRFGTLQRDLLPLLLVALGCARSSEAWAQGQEREPLCDAPELVGYEPYDALVCSAVAHMEAGDFELARVAVEEALEIQLHEIPNVLLYARLAKVAAHQGDAVTALENLRRGATVLRIYTDIYRCKAENRADQPVVDKFGNTVALDSVEREVAAEMCAPAYDYLYWQQRSLESLQWEARLTDIFDAAQAGL